MFIFRKEILTSCLNLQILQLCTLCIYDLSAGDLCDGLQI
jgi:hypothetical protein